MPKAKDVKYTILEIDIEGDSDLILCKKSRSFEMLEIFKQSHPKGTEVPKTLLQPYNMWEKLITSVHWMKPIEFHDDDWSKYTEEEWQTYMTENSPVILGKAFKDALAEAFISLGFKESTGKAGTDFKRCTEFERICPVSFAQAGYDQHLVMTNTASKVNVLTQQNVFSGWMTTVKVTLFERTLPADTLVSMFSAAGTFIGVGSRRSEGYGRYHVAEVRKYA